MEHILTNNHVITLGYGKQSENDKDYGRGRLKFARFMMFAQDNIEIFYESKYAQTCKGRS